MRPSHCVLGALLIAFFTFSPQQALHAQVGVPVLDADLDKVEKYSPCVPIAQSGYKDKECLIQIYRDAPITPPALTVPVGTTVVIELLNTRWNENVTFTLTTTHTTTQDVAAAAVKNAIPGIQTIVFDTATTPSHAMSTSSGIFDLQKAVSNQQQALTDQLNKGIIALLNANAQLTCLSSYETFMPTNTCSQASMLSPDKAGVIGTFTPAKAAATLQLWLRLIMPSLSLM